METLAIKLSELLDITFKGAMDLLPVLQKEFIPYKIGGLLSIIWWISLLVSAICIFIAICNHINNYESDNVDMTTVKKVFIMGIICLLLGKIIQILFSPTILMILEIKNL